jgi:hypothetical protein
MLSDLMRQGAAETPAANGGIDRRTGAVERNARMYGDRY